MATLTEPRPVLATRRGGPILPKVLRTVLVLGLLAVVLYPLAWLLATSFKPDRRGRVEPLARAGGADAGELRPRAGSACRP